MITISRDNHSYYFDKRNKPVKEVEVGEEVMFETYDCWKDQIKGEDDLADSINMSYMNPTTGPIYVPNTSPGDILKVELLDIEPEDHGVLTLIPDEGKLDPYVKAPMTKIVEIKDGYTYFTDDIVIKNKPHVGTIGTTPVGRIPTGLIGDHGGNMDCPEVGVGSSLYFPVFVEGSLLQLGDVHANMGEGEIAIGVECGARVTLKLTDIIKNRSIPAPIIEKDSFWFLVANDPSLEEAIRIGTKRMADFLVDKLEVSMEEAALLVSIAGNVRVAQDAEAGYDRSIYVQFPKYVDNKKRLEKI